jgi:hypothetical protein
MALKRLALVTAALLMMIAPAFAQEHMEEAADNGAAEAEPEGKAEEVPPSEEIESRWGIEPPPYDLNVKGHWWDPYNQNILKGDYPVIGHDIFLKLTGISKTTAEGNSAPIPSGVSTEDPGSFQFFGQSDRVIFDEKMVVRADLQKGSTTFKPFEWQVSLEGVFNVNHLGVFERNAVSPDTRDGTDRTTVDAALQEASVEIHLANVSTNYDFISSKIGRQPFNSDFRSLIFADVNQGVRLFGSANGNRYQYNLLYFYQAEKDTNSELNTFDFRHQQIAVANVYLQDFLTLGYTQQLSVHYNHDDGKDSGYKFDRQGFLVRPDPIGIARPHNLDVVYLGWTSEGHIDWLNISHAVYQALGHDTRNPLAGRQLDINAQLAFLELSVDRDWMRYQTSVFFTSGDDDPRDGQGRGFDSILDFPKIMGGDFSWWQRQSIRIADRGGVALMQRQSLIPDLRSSKIQGQSNFVNPGILMFNVGATAEVTPKFRAIFNTNYIRFVQTEPLEILLKQPNVRKDVGVDISLGFEWRPLLNNNIIVKPFAAMFQPVAGFKDIFQASTLYQVGTDIVLLF